jgi:hypothetical protein
MPRRAPSVRLWPNPDLLWDHRLHRLLEDKRTRYARGQFSRVCPEAVMAEPSIQFELRF